MPPSRSDIKAGSAYVELLLRKKAFLQGLKGATDRLAAFGRAAKRVGSFGILGGRASGLTRVFAGAGAAAALSFPVQLAAKLETAQAQFETLTGSAEKAREIIAAIERFSPIALIPVDELQRGAQTLLGYGQAAEGMVPSLMALAEISRGSRDRFNRLALALGQTIAKTRLYAQEVRQFVEAGLNPLQQIAERTGETMEQVSARMEAGAISAGEVGEALQAAVGPGGRFHGLLEQLGSTASGLFSRLRVGIMLAVRPLGQSLLPSLKGVLEVVTKDAIPSFGKFIRQNASMITASISGMAAVAGLAAGIVSLGLATQISSFALGGITTLLTLLTNPITLVIGAVAGLATWFATATTWGRQMVSALAGWFQDLRDIAADAFGGIADALAAGNLQLAAQVAMAGVNLAWLQGTNSIREMWAGFKDFYLRTTTEMVFGALRGWVKFRTSVASIWAGMVTQAQGYGEMIGHYLTRSSDPATRADQDRAHAAAMRNIENQGRAKLDAIVREEAPALARLEEDRRAAEQERSRAFNQDLEQRREALKTAREELDALRMKAAEERKERELKAGPDFNNKKFKLGGGQIAAEVFGSFSAAALAAQGRGGGGADPNAERIAKAIEKAAAEQAKRDERVLERLAEQGLNP